MRGGSSDVDGFFSGLAREPFGGKMPRTQARRNGSFAPKTDSPRVTVTEPLCVSGPWHDPAQSVIFQMCYRIPKAVRERGRGL
jgi:hypothetical protein